METYRGNEFSWNKMYGSACASDLGFGVPTRSWPTRFDVVSHKTGRKLRFEACGAELDNEDEVVSIDYANWEKTIFIKIIND